MKNLKTKTLALISAIVCMSTIFSLFTVTVTAQDAPDEYYVVNFATENPETFEESLYVKGWVRNEPFENMRTYGRLGIKTQQTSHQGIVRFNSTIDDENYAVGIVAGLIETFNSQVGNAILDEKTGDMILESPVVEIVDIVPTSSGQYTDNDILGYFGVIFDGEGVDEFIEYMQSIPATENRYSNDIASWNYIDNPEIEDMTYETPVYRYVVVFDGIATEEEVQEAVAAFEQHGEASYEVFDKYILNVYPEFPIYEEINRAEGDEYSDLMVQLVRKGNISYMSDLWYREVYFQRQHVSFERAFGVVTKDYIFDPEDFSEIVGMDKVEVYKYSLTDYALVFETFDDAYYASMAFEEIVADENSPIISAGRVQWLSTQLAIFPTWDDVMKYMTPAEIEANREHFEGMSKNYTHDNFFNEIEYDENLDYDTNLTPLKADFIRERLEHKYNSFMPDEWFFEKSKYCFRRFAGIVFEEGYEYNAEDFAEYGVVSIEENFDGYSVDAYQTLFSHHPDLKCIVFDSFESLENNRDAINENPNVDWIYNNFSNSIAYELIYPTLEDVEKYLTPAEISENIEILEEMEDFFALDFVNDIEFEIDSELDSEINSDLPKATIYGDINNDNKVQMADIVVLCRAISAEDVTTVLTPQEIANADVYADGILDSTDLSVFSSAMVNSQLSALPVKMSNE